MDFYNYYMGNEFEAYRFLGAHFSEGTTTFRTFAPKGGQYFSNRRIQRLVGNSDEKDI